MSSTYSTNLRFLEQGTGDNPDNWGTLVNSGVTDLADFAIAGMTTINSVGGVITLTSNNGAADQARSAILNITGVLASDINLVAPSVTKVYVIANNTTGVHNVTINTSGGVAVNLPQTTVNLVYCDGTNFHALTAPAPALSGTAVGNIDMAYFLFDRASIKRYKEVFFDNGTTGGAITADYNNGNCQKFTLNANSTLSVTNFPNAGAYAGSMTVKLVQDGVGNRTMTWPASFKFPSGTSSVLSTIAGAVDILTVYTDDNAVTYNCNLTKQYQ